MKKHIISIIFALIVFANISVVAFADCGPKYSVTVTVTGISNGLEYYGEPGGVYYATLLSRGKTTGPLLRLSRTITPPPRSRKGTRTRYGARSRATTMRTDIIIFRAIGC